MFQADLELDNCYVFGNKSLDQLYHKKFLVLFLTHVAKQGQSVFWVAGYDHKND